MSTEIASLEKVRAAVLQIRSNGGTATADRVIAHLGGGSKATVLRHLKALRDGEAPENSVPPAVMDLARSALAEIYAAGAKAEADRSAAGLVRLTTAIHELDAQIDELAAENASQLERIGVLQSGLEEAAGREEGLEAALARSAQELRTARNELALERGASAEKLASLMTRIEASVASISRNPRANRNVRDGPPSS